MQLQLEHPSVPPKALASKAISVVGGHGPWVITDVP